MAGDRPENPAEHRETRAAGGATHRCGPGGGVPAPDQLVGSGPGDPETAIRGPVADRNAVPDDKTSVRAQNQATDREVGECRHGADLLCGDHLFGAQYLPPSGVRGDNGIRTAETD